MGVSRGVLLVGGWFNWKKRTHGRNFGVARVVAGRGVVERGG